LGYINDNLYGFNIPLKPKQVKKKRSWYSGILFHGSQAFCILASRRSSLAPHFLLNCKSPPLSPFSMVVWFVNAEFAPKKKIESFERKNVIATARTNITTVPGDKSHEKIVEGVLS